MTTYQDIQPKIQMLTEQSKRLALMTRDEIFQLISELILLSDELNIFVRDLDLQIAKVENEAFEKARAEKMNASMATIAMKNAVAPYKLDKEWATKQNSLLNELRIAALAAQRGAE